VTMGVGLRAACESCAITTGPYCRRASPRPYLRGRGGSSLGPLDRDSVSTTSFLGWTGVNLAISEEVWLGPKMRKPRKAVLTAICLLLTVMFWWVSGLVLGAVEGWYLRVQPAPKFDQIDLALRKLGDRDTLKNSDYDFLFSYFLEGIVAYRNHDNSQILYPGVPGTRGTTVEGLEGFSRSGTLLAAWINSGRRSVLTLTDGTEVNLVEHLVRGVIHGTDPESNSYWGKMEDLDQRTVESADIALILWLLKKEFLKIPSNQLEKIMLWLSGVNSVQIYGGNWHLFRIIVNVVLDDFGFSSVSSTLNTDYKKLKRMHVGNGWFSDGKGGDIDYYNVWQFQYSLFWLSRIQPEFDKEFLREVFREFSAGYKYLITAGGIPIFGRSVCYRLAASAPLVIHSLVDKGPISSGIARRALDATTSYFIGKGSIKSGTVTQGYCGADTELLENYLGRASCLWSLRALVVAFYAPENLGLWKARPIELPIEEASFSVLLSGPNLEVKGEFASGQVNIRQLNPRHREKRTSDAPLVRMPMWRKFLEQILRRPLRLDNYAVKYGRNVYSSAYPFCDCKI
jgi:hypothetical protein